MFLKILAKWGLRKTVSFFGDTHTSEFTVDPVYKTYDCFNIFNPELQTVVFKVL